MRVEAVINPASGDGHAQQRWQQIADSLDADTVTHAPSSRDDAVATARRAATDGSLVVAVGGDGLVRDVACGVADTGASMAIVPAGRGNDLHDRLGLPTDAAEIAAMIEAGTTRTIDALDVNGHIVPGNAYVGVDSVAARMINDHRWVPAPVLYRAAGVVAVMRWKPTTFILDITDADGTERSTSVQAHAIVLANSGRYGHGLNIVPSAQLDDGLVDVMVVEHGPKHRIGAFLLAAQKGTHVERDDVEVFQASQIHISADRDVPFGADGDEVTELPATVTVRRNALRLVVPHEPRSMSAT